MRITLRQAMPVITIAASLMFSANAAAADRGPALSWGDGTPLELKWGDGTPLEVKWGEGTLLDE